jgi:YegS/Rv2252/BmrU family lipid kinase
LKIAIILNGISSKKKKFYTDILPALQESFAISVFETNHAGHAQTLAAELGKKYSVLIAAGGDGTLQEVLNGIMTLSERPALGVIPLGSGNDFAGACGIVATAASIQERLHQPARPTDIGKIICYDEGGQPIEKFFMNVCSVGMGPSTVSRMKTKPAWLGTNGKYLLSILQTFFMHQPEGVTLRSEGFEWTGKARVVAIANGKSFGNKIYIAPHAKAEDGIFDIFIGGNVPLLKFLFYLQQIKGKKLIQSTDVHYAMGKKIELAAEQKVMLEADGELGGYLPARIEVASAKINFLR